MASSHGSSYSGGMGKARTYDLENTNIAHLDSDLAKAIRQAAAECEQEWQNAGKRPGVQVWRIEKFKVVQWPPKQYGKFYSGDSYIILHTYRKHGDGALAWDAHFWIGAQSSQDEYGTAAYKTVELDDYLSGSATQYREVQGHESARFKALFKVIQIMEGGVDSGFNQVKPLEYRHRLLQVKGRMNVMVREVPRTYKSLNSGDTFIYDGGLKVLIWQGKNASAMEKSKAAAIAQNIDDERGGKPERKIFHEGQEGGDDEWWMALGGKGPIASAEEGGSDDQMQNFLQSRLCVVSDASGKLQMTVVAEGANIRRDMLHTNDVFIFDDGKEVMVWVGKGASVDERKYALDSATAYLKQFGLSPDTPVARILEGAENEVFEGAFENGVLSMARPGDGKKFTGNIADIRANQKTGAAAQSAQATYAGSGGPGTVTDLDAIYQQQGADPAQWGGRTQAQSAYAQQLQQGKHGAYSASSGWVSGATKEQLAATEARVNEIRQNNADSHPATGGGGDKFALMRSFKGERVPTIRGDHSKFNAKEDAMELRKAMKGLGTNEKKLINILCNRTLTQRMAIRENYTQFVRRNLEKDIIGDTSGNFCSLLKALVRSPAERDARFLYKAIKGLGTDDVMLIEILCTREATEIVKIKEVYKREYQGHELETDIIGDTSGDYRKLLLSLLECKRMGPSVPLDEKKAAEDAKILYRAGEKRWGTDEEAFIEIFTHRSFKHLNLVFDEYAKICKYDIRESISRETSGNFKLGLKTICDYARNAPELFAHRLKKTMKGLGTNNRLLMHILVERSDIDLQSVKDAFLAGNGKSLGDWIKEDTSGDFRRGLMMLIGEPMDK